MSFDLLTFIVDETETSLRVAAFTDAQGRVWSLLGLGTWTEADHTAWTFDLFWLAHLMHP